MKEVGMNSQSLEICGAVHMYNWISAGLWHPPQGGHTRGQGKAEPPCMLKKNPICRENMGF